MVDLDTGSVAVKEADIVTNPVDVIATLVDVTPATVVVISVDNSRVSATNVEPIAVRLSVVVSTLV